MVGLSRPEVLVEFNHYVSHWEKAQKNPGYFPALRSRSRKPAQARFDFYSNGIRSGMTDERLAPDTRQTLVGEFTLDLLWYGADRCYYRVWPEAIDKLLAADLSDHTGSQFRPRTSSFALHFPAGQRQLTLLGASLRSCLVSIMSHEETTLALKHICRMHGSKGDNVEELIRKILGPAAQAGGRFVNLLLLSDLPEGEGDGTSLDMTCSQTFILHDVILVDHALVDLASLNEARQIPPDAKSGMETFLKCLRLSLAMAMQDGGLVHPDVLQNDFNKYQEALSRREYATVDRLHRRAEQRRQGQLGYTVGRPGTPAVSRYAF